MDEIKILFAGPTGAGKTTAINTVSEISVVSTEVSRSSLDTESVISHAVPKNTVTIGIDYGEFSFDTNTRMRLYGVPGQIRFEFLWDLIHKGSGGTVILFDISSNTFKEDVKFYFERFREVLLNDRCLIGVSKYEEAYSSRVNEIMTLVHDLSINVPVVSIDVRNRDDVLKLLQMLVK